VVSRDTSSLLCSAGSAPIPPAAGGRRGIFCAGLHPLGAAAVSSSTCCILNLKNEECLKMEGQTLASSSPRRPYASARARPMTVCLTPSAVPPAGGRLRSLGWDVEAELLPDACAPLVLASLEALRRRADGGAKRARLEPATPRGGGGAPRTPAPWSGTRASSAASSRAPRAADGGGGGGGGGGSWRGALLPRRPGDRPAVDGSLAPALLAAAFEAAEETFERRPRKFRKKFVAVRAAALASYRAAVAGTGRGSLDDLEDNADPYVFDLNAYALFATVAARAPDGASLDAFRARLRGASLDALLGSAPPPDGARAVDALDALGRRLCARGYCATATAAATARGVSLVLGSPATLVGFDALDAAGSPAPDFAGAAAFALLEGRGVRVARATTARVDDDLVADFALGGGA